MFPTFRRSTALGLVAAVLALGGCRPAASTVSGRVVYNGKPLNGGSVVMFGPGEKLYTGLIGADGRYAIANVPPGDLRVTVKSHTAVPYNFNVGSRAPAAVNGPKGPTEGPPPAPVPPIPDRYGVPEESGLAVTVGRGETTFDITLTR
jgi:hypothetical protein